MAATEIVAQPSGDKIIRYYPRAKPDESVIIRKDIQYNNSAYELQFMEFFVSSLHAYTADTDAQASERYDAELVMYHRSGDKSKWVNVSVFLNPRYTYSISQGFFSALIDPLCSGSDDMSGCKSLSGVKSYLRTLSQSSLIPDAGTPCPVNESSGGSMPSDASRCVPIATSDKWNPYMALPHKKAFYIYRGGFPCAESVPNMYPADGKDVRWVLMANTVPIHYNDYEHLRKIIKPQKGSDKVEYRLNKGILYPLHEIGTRPIYYNNGDYVQGNMERDQFFVRCTKKEQPAAVKNLSFAANTEMDTADDLQSVQKKNAMFLFYQPPSSTMSIIVLSFVLAGLLLWMFDATSKPKKRLPTTDIFIMFLVIAIFAIVVLDSAVQSSGKVIMVPGIIIIGLFILNMIFRKVDAFEYPNSTVALHVTKCLFLIWMFMMIMTSVYNKSSSYGSERMYYYITTANGISIDPSTSILPNDARFFVGTKMDTIVQLTGAGSGMMSYRNVPTADGEADGGAMERMFEVNMGAANNTLIPDTAQQAALNASYLKVSRMNDVVKRYNKNMTTDHRNPRKQFEEAAWFELKPYYKVKSQTKAALTGANGNLIYELEPLMEYLENNPTEATIGLSSQ